MGKTISKKPQVKVAESAAILDKPLLILSFYEGDKAHAQIWDSQMQQAQRLGNNLKWLIVNNSDNEPGGKAYTEMLETGRIKMLRANGKSELAAAIQSFHSGPALVFQPESGISLRESALAFSKSLKNSETIYAGCYRQADLKGGLRAYFNTILTTFTAAPSFSVAWNCFGADSSLITALLPEKFSDNPFKDAYMRGFTSDIPVGSFHTGISNAALIAAFFKKFWARIKFVSFSARAYWYLKRPIELLKGSEPMAFEHGANRGIYRGLYAYLALLLLIIMPAVSLHYGISWDEPLQNDYGKDIVEYYLSFGEKRDVIELTKPKYATMIFYGCSFDTLCGLVNKILPGVGEYEVRHFINALSGWLAFLFIALLARLLGGWRAAFATLAIMAVSGSFFGHSMFNPKDIPFALGYVMSIYYTLVILRELPHARPGTMLKLIIAIALTISVRIGGLLNIAYIGLFGGIVWLAIWQNHGKETAVKALPKLARQFIIIAVCGFLLGLIIWPYGQLNPIKNPFNALKNFSNFAYLTSYERFDGERIHMNTIPWYYIPKLLFYGTPLILWALTAAFFIFLLVKNQGRKILPEAGVLLFVIIFPIAYAVYKDSLLYNGWRHFLFVYPFVAAMAALGLGFLLDAAKSKAIKSAIWAVAAAGWLLPAWWMIRSHPNQYIYFNELSGGLKKAHWLYETDYYSNTLRQAAEWVNEHDKRAEVIVTTNNEPVCGDYYLKKGKPDSRVVWSREYELHKQVCDYSFITTRTMSRAQIENTFPPKGTVHMIEVDGAPILAIVKRENNYAALGMAYNDRGMHDSALLMLNKAIEYDPTNEEAYRARSLAFTGLQRFDEAKADVREGLRLVPESFMTYDALAQCYFRQEKLDSAIWAFEKSVSVKVNYTGGYYNLGICQMNVGRYLEAEENFKKAIKYGGQKADFYLMGGRAVLMSGQPERSIDYFNYALQLDPNLAEVYFYASEAYKAMGNKQAADATMQKFMQMRGQ